MLNIRLFVISLLILCLAGLSACKKEEAAPAADAAPAAEAKADEAKAEAPAVEAKADEAKAGAAAEAANVDKLAAFFEGLGKVATEANGDCDKLGTGLMELLEKDRAGLTADMKKLAALDEDSAEAKKLKEVMDKVMADDSALTKGTEACKENEKILAFNMGLLSVIMAAAPADEEAVKEAAEAAVEAAGEKAAEVAAEKAADAKAAVDAVAAANPEVAAKAEAAKAAIDAAAAAVAK